MVNKYDPVNIIGFKDGESVQMTFALRDRAIPPAKAGGPLASAATQVVTFTVSEQTDTISIVQFNAAPDITLADADLALWDVNLRTADLALLVADTTYDFDLWSKLGAADPIHQRNGTIKLESATPPA